MQARIVLAACGIVIWGYALAVDDANLRLVGIILLALSLVLRFARRRGRDGGESGGPDRGGGGGAL